MNLKRRKTGQNSGLFKPKVCSVFFMYRLWEPKKSQHNENNYAAFCCASIHQFWNHILWSVSSARAMVPHQPGWRRRRWFQIQARAYIELESWQNKSAATTTTVSEVLCSWWWCNNEPTIFSAKLSLATKPCPLGTRTFAWISFA